MTMPPATLLSLQNGPPLGGSSLGGQDDKQLLLSAVRNDFELPNNVTGYPVSKQKVESQRKHVACSAVG